MIKRVILDIDNTLIHWEEKYDNEIKNALDELNIEYTENDYNEILKAFCEYENEYYSFDRKLMIEFINKYTKKNYPEEFIHKVTKKWENCTPDIIDEDIKKLLDYLKNKYELVILTDWFGDQQAKRLEKIGILQYFSEIFAAENVKRKPFKEAFIRAIEENKPEECIMIGDDFERDIKGALNAGLKAVYYNPKGAQKSEEYYTISNLYELKEIL